MAIEPITRIEHYIDSIIEGTEAFTPVCRVEHYLNDILNGEVSTLVPVTRIEHYLAKASGADVYTPTPVTRIEIYLAAIAGEDIEVPPPKTRLEHFLHRWVEEGLDVVLTATGVSPLSLVNAVAKAIVSLTQYGKCAQSGTPTPDNPIDIKCNNGVLKMVHRSGLPSGYTLLEYVGGNGSQYIVTNVYLASTDVVEAEYKNSSTTGYGAVYGIYKSGESSALYGNQSYYGYDESNSKVDTGVSVDTDWHSSRHDFVNGTLTIDNTTVNFTPWTFVNGTKNAVLTRYYNGSYGYHWKGYIRKFKVTRGNEVVCDLIPAKDGEGVAGLYDLISGSFYTATGGTLIEGNVVDDYDFVVVGTPEVLTIGEQTASTVDLFSVGDYADTQEIISGLLTRKVGIKVLDGTETGWALSDSGTTHRFRGTKPSDSITPTSRGAIVSTHFVYAYAGQTQGGAFIGASTYWYFIPTDQTIDTADKWKAWLAAQYAAGTPVVMLYPLAESTTEQVTPQHLSTSAGTNTITVTAEVDDIELKCEYKSSRN